MNTITLNLRPFRASKQRDYPGRQPFAWLRSRAYGVLIRLALLAGFRVLVIGPVRAGKTYLLERTFPANRLIDGAEGIRRGLGCSTPFSLATLPDGMLALDEPQGFNVRDLKAALQGLQDRRIVVSAQTIKHLESAGLAALFEGGRTLVLHIDHADAWGRLP